MATDIILEITNLQKTYPSQEKPALVDLNLKLARGEALGLLGPNGAGKTTTLAIIATRIKASSGQVMIAGFNGEFEKKKVRKCLGFVPQDIALYPTLSGRENLRFFGTLYGLKGDKLAHRVQHCLDFVAMTKQADQLVASYSGGMKRRINLAVGIIHQPDLLLLDEPTVGIDIQSRTMIIDKLEDLRAHGTTLVYTSHYMEEVEKLCDTVLVIDHGHIIAQGNPVDLIAEYNCLGLGELFLQITGRQLRE